MDYAIENMDIDNVEYYARVNTLSWKQSYKGIVMMIWNYNNKK